MSESTTRNVLNPTRELFKYRAVNEYTLALLSTGAVYFSSPAEFNDPFDTRFVERDLRAQQQQLERERRAQGTDAALLGVAMMNAFEREHRAGGVKTRIYCVSEIVDSILMWSHYADSHCGICVVLEAEEIGEPWWIPFAASSVSFAEMASVRTAADGRIEIVDREPSPSDQIVMLPAQQVLYSDQAPGLFMFDPLPHGPMRGVTFEFVKHTAWAYERERRVVVRESFLAENPAHLASDAIVGVVFGMKIPKADVLRVRAAIDCCVRARPIAYSRMIDRPDGFALDRIPVPDIDEFIRSL
jgi:hypothetical protein